VNSLDQHDQEQQRLYDLEQWEFADQQLGTLKTNVETLTPSEWAERRRYLPPSVTSMPGRFRFSVVPYMREIVDCMGVDSPIREVYVMKGGQLAYTTAALENVIGYGIDHEKTAPMLLVTADNELAKMRLEANLAPMLQHSGLQHLITASDAGNRRKTGQTDKKWEWVGGGYLVPLGAQNANKFRQQSFQKLLLDEVDAWPDVFGKEGDPVEIVKVRAKGFELSRKIMAGSTPTVKDASKIEQLFEQGDQRRYFVNCLKCGFSQWLKFRPKAVDGVLAGLQWDYLDAEKLQVDPSSVRYLCQNPDCQHPHTNDDKTRLLDPANGAEWRPTATAFSPHVRSYHIPSLLSPVGMQTWTAIAEAFAKAYDEHRKRPRDIGKLQAFYNTELGEPFELMGSRVKVEHVSGHRRACYGYGQIPNEWAREHCGGAIQLLTCSVDVHADRLKVAVFGWTVGRRCFLVDYQTFEGDTEQLDNAATWGELYKLIEEQRYEADDGRRYGIAITVVDSGYHADTVYNFCAQWPAGVYPIKGRDAPPKSATVKYFSEFEALLGVEGFTITVDLYKERWNAALKIEWSGLGLQPLGHFNAPGREPNAVTDKQLKELTAEVKAVKTDPQTGRKIGFTWRRPPGSANELWDLLIYSSAALDMLAWDYFGRGEDEDFEKIDWALFFENAEADGLYLSD
jgi:phage terminase large subunit GpA-like protein